MRLPNSRGCIVCGRENPIGLKLAFDKTETGVQTLVTPGLQFQGFDGVLQGGIAAGLMDDAMWYAIFGHTQAVTMTAELQVRYKRPVPADAPLTVIGRLAEQRRSLYTCEAQIVGPDGTVLAEATGKFLAAPREIAAQLTAHMKEEPR